MENISSDTNFSNSDDENNRNNASSNQLSHIDNTSEKIDGIQDH